MSRNPPFKILIVEDEQLLVFDIEMLVEDGGDVVVGDAASFDEVRALKVDAPDLAFVDVELANQSSGLDVSQYIQGQWPDALIVFVTANPKKLPDDFGGAHGVIAKPFTRNGFLSALAYLKEGLTDPPPISAKPGSFVSSPRLAAAWA